MVAITAYEKVAGRYLGILLVEIGLLLCDGSPTVGVGRLLHLHGNSLCSIVVESHHEWNGTVATGALQVAVVVHPLAVATVEGVGLLVESVEEVAPCGVFIFVVATSLVVDDDNLGLTEHFFARRNVDCSIDYLSEHVEPDALEVGELCPIAACVAVDSGVVHLMQALLAPSQFRTVPDCTSIAAHLFHDGTDTSCSRILLPMTFAKDSIEGAIPSAVVVAHTVVLGQTRDEGPVSDAFVVVEARRRGVLIEPKNGLGILLAGVQQVFVAFHHAHRVEGVTPDVATKRDGQETAILVVHGNELCK